MNPGKKKYFDKIVTFLGGIKLSFILLILLGGLAFQRAIISQKTIAMEEAPWFLKILNSIGLDSPDSLVAPVLAVVFFFAINLVLSSFRMARRITAKQKAAREFKTADAIRNLPNNAEFQTTSKKEQEVIDFFKQKGFKIAKEDADTELRIYAGKRKAGFWGALFFHMTFMILMAGALLSILTRYAGYVELSPGETFVEKRDNYRAATERPLLFGADRLFKLRLEKIDLSYWKPGVVKQRASIVSLYDVKDMFLGEHRIQVNEPLSIEGINIYQGSRQGFIAELEAIDSEGNKAPGIVRFLIPHKPDDRMISRVTLPGTNLNIELELFTERLGDIEGLEVLRSKYMATLIKVTSTENGRRIFQGVVFLGSRLSFEGLTLRFVDLRPYSSLVFVRDKGVPVIFASFAFLLPGLLILYFWVPENYWAVITNDAAIIGATAERYRESFKQRFVMQMAELKEGLKA